MSRSPRARPRQNKCPIRHSADGIPELPSPADAHLRLSDRRKGPTLFFDPGDLPGTVRRFNICDQNLRFTERQIKSCQNDAAFSSLHKIHRSLTPTLHPCCASLVPGGRLSIPLYLALWQATLDHKLRTCTSLCDGQLFQPTALDGLDRPILHLRIALLAFSSRKSRNGQTELSSFDSFVGWSAPAPACRRPWQTSL